MILRPGLNHTPHDHPEILHTTKSPHFLRSPHKLAHVAPVLGYSPHSLAADDTGVVEVDQVLRCR